MEITAFHKNLTKAEEQLFDEHVVEKAESIITLLTKFAEDAKTLKVSIEKFNKHDAFEVEFCLVLPSKTLVSKEASHSIQKAADSSKDRLVAQIKKHLAHLRKERAHKSIREEDTAQRTEAVFIESV